MKPTMKAFFLSGVLAIAALFAVPSLSEAHGGRWRGPRPYYGHYYPRPYGAYYYGSAYPGYSYYTPGVTVYPYQPYRYYSYYGYGPRAALRVGPVGVWW